MMCNILTATVVGLTIMIGMAKKSSNPMKMCLILALICMIMMLNFYVTKSASWFSWTFTLLFLGGILIMFLILSSLMPNQKPGKIKMSMTTIIVMTMAIPSTWMPTEFQVSEASKWFSMGAWNFLVIILIITLYFMAFMSTLKQSKNSMRSSASI